MSDMQPTEMNAHRVPYARSRHSWSRLTASMCRTCCCSSSNARAVPSNIQSFRRFRI